MKNALLITLVCLPLTLLQAANAQTNKLTSVQPLGSKLGDSQSAAELKEKQKQWQQAIDQFATADTDTVLSPYMQVISQMNELPQQRWCQPDQLSKLEYAIELNPSSLLAHSMLFNCATKAHKKEARARHLETLNGLISLLIDTKEATSIENIIEVRELMEAPLLLQAMGYSILDMDLVSRYGGLYYRYHVMDLNTNKVSVRFLSNLQFMKRLLSNPDISDDLAAGLMAKYYEKQQMPFATNRKAKQLIFQGKYQQAEEYLDTSQNFTKGTKVLYGQIYLDTKQTEKFNQLYNPLTIDAKSGFIPASIILARWYLSQNEPQKVTEQLALIDNFTKQGEGAYQMAQALLQATPNDTSIIDWYQQAVDAKHPKATFALAKAYIKGQLVNRNINEAIKLLHKAYDLGLEEAGIELVNYYHLGSDQTKPDHQKSMQILQQLAANENATAYVMLGKRFANAIGVEQDAEQAFTWFKKAYQLGQGTAANPIAILYERGLLPDENLEPGQPNYEQATLWYERAGDRGDYNGFINLARHALYGLGRDKSLKDAEQYYIKAAETGSIVAYCRLADTILLGGNRYDENWNKRVERVESLYLHGVKKNNTYCPRQLGFFYQTEKPKPIEAQKWYEVGAENGDQIAARMLERIYFDAYLAEDHQTALKNFSNGTRIGLVKSSYYLGKMYHLGLGVERDDQKALALWQNAASKGFKLAEKSIMLLFFEGQQSVKDTDKAKHLFDNWAAQSLEHTIEVAEWFYFGQGTAVNYEMALTYYQKAVAGGSDHAMNNLGEMYRLGNGVKQDYQKALALYRQSAKQGNIIAGHNIGEMHLFGQGLPQDFTKAKQMLTISANQGLSESQYLLGLMYQNGQGMPVDTTTANQWFNIAMGSRHSGAKYMFAQNLIAGNGLEKNLEKAHLLLTEAAEAGYQSAIDFFKNKR